MIISAAVQLRQDTEKLASKLQYLKEAHRTLKTDIAISKRAAEKGTSDISIAQDDMLRKVNGCIV